MPLPWAHRWSKRLGLVESGLTLVETATFPPELDHSSKRHAIWPPWSYGCVEHEPSYCCDLVQGYWDPARPSCSGFGEGRGLELQTTSRSCPAVGWLVVGNIFYFSINYIYMGNSNPNWLIFFRGLKPPTSWSFRGVWWVITLEGVIRFSIQWWGASAAGGPLESWGATEAWGVVGFSAGCKNHRMGLNSMVYGRYNQLIHGFITAGHHPAGFWSSFPSPPSKSQCFGINMPGHVDMLEFNLARWNAHLM